ncbi:alpha-1,4 polygalactosaminidase, partial [Shimia thalassica]|nr:alpha-1,4 polygalactosaminidase [Shimia thalassica]
KAFFLKLSYAPYTDAKLAFAPIANETGQPGRRRPGVAILSRYGFVVTPEIIQVLDTPLKIPFSELTGEDGGYFTISRLSRP